MTDRLKLLLAAGCLMAAVLALSIMLVQVKAKLSAEAKAHKAEREAHAITTEALGTCRANVANLDAAISSQNEAVRALELAGAERERQAGEAIQRAKSEASRYRKAALDLAKAQPGPNRCESAASLMRATLEAER